MNLTQCFLVVRAFAIRVLFSVAILTDTVAQTAAAGSAAPIQSGGQTSAKGSAAVSSSPAPEAASNNGPTEVVPVTNGTVHPEDAARKAWGLVMVGLVVGSLIVIALWALLWRDAQPKSGASPEEVADRINTAASGLPTPLEMSSWPIGKLRAIVAGLAGFEDYEVRQRPSGQDIDMELRRRGDPKPRVLVKCSPGEGGIVSLKQIREVLVAALAAEGVRSGWYVSPEGFSTEASSYAKEQHIVLIDRPALQSLLREVPPISLPGLLAKE